MHMTIQMAFPEEQEEDNDDDNDNDADLIDGMTLERDIFRTFTSLITPCSKRLPVAYSPAAKIVHLIVPKPNSGYHTTCPPF